MSYGVVLWHFASKLCEWKSPF